MLQSCSNESILCLSNFFKQKCQDLSCLASQIWTFSAFLCYFAVNWISLVSFNDVATKNLMDKHQYFLILYMKWLMDNEQLCRCDSLKIQVCFPSGDCKYKFGPWGSCDAVTNTKSRSGTLKRALFNADCQTTVSVSKPCSPKVKKTRGEDATRLIKETYYSL